MASPRAPLPGGSTSVRLARETARERERSMLTPDAAAREALRELDRRRSLPVRAWISSWALDVPLALTRVEVPLVEA